ncbi:hypothetical protein [Campylobacter sp. MG1]|uniref:hypothetical protein n=1 Tax=Campylobacter sp. MG1 TaxID=2976332 RepID=UPI00226CAA8E|nr:hypothetical protein [Campylobacter sp. MG1]
MKFEKKVILGSIGGFITTALGIIAVFFPSVFNLEKKTMEEINIFIKSQADVDNLRKAIEKNQGKVVKLNVTYCYYYYDYDESNELRTVGDYNEKIDKYNIEYKDFWLSGARNCLLTEEGCKFNENGLTQGVVLYGGVEIGDYLHENEGEGSLVFRNNYKDIDDNRFFYLSVPHETKGKYAWKFNNDEEGCIKSSDPNLQYRELIKETLTGTFYVNELKDRLREGEGTDLEIELDPLTKKELTLRDY